jgi:bifunctional DNA-binding transcriptional regulator/antitoxin component of YhaV-PrlF toxin-antitoxin module
MKSGMYIAEIDKEYRIRVPEELIKKIKLNPGDKVEILIKKIKGGKKIIAVADTDLLDILKIGENDT